MGEMVNYEKLIILEAQKLIKDEEEEILEIISEKYKHYKMARSEYVKFYWLFTRIISSARNMNAILNLAEKIDNIVEPSNMIAKNETEQLDMILKCPNVYYMQQDTIDLVRQSISNLRYNKKTLYDIYYCVKRNKHLMEVIDSVSIGRQNDLTKCLPNLVDSLISKIEI